MGEPRDPGGAARRPLRYREGAYSRQYGAGSSLGAVTSSTSVSPAVWSGPAEHLASHPLPPRLPGSACPAPTWPDGGWGGRGVPPTGADFPFILALGPWLRGGAAGSWGIAPGGHVDGQATHSLAGQGPAGRGDGFGPAPASTASWPLSLSSEASRGEGSDRVSPKTPPGPPAPCHNGDGSGGGKPGAGPVWCPAWRPTWRMRLCPASSPHPAGRCEHTLLGGPRRWMEGPNALLPRESPRHLLPVTALHTGPGGHLGSCAQPGKGTVSQTRWLPVCTMGSEGRRGEPVPTLRAQASCLAATPPPPPASGALELFPWWQAGEVQEEI